MFPVGSLGSLNALTIEISHWADWIHTINRPNRKIIDPIDHWDERLNGKHPMWWGQIIFPYVFTSILMYHFVSVPPLSVHILGSNQPLSASRRYDLLCQSSGSRPPASITWWKNGHRINNAKETVSAYITYLTIWWSLTVLSRMERLPILFCIYLSKRHICLYKTISQ